MQAAVVRQTSAGRGETCLVEQLGPKRRPDGEGKLAVSDHVAHGLGHGVLLVRRLGRPADLPVALGVLELLVQAPIAVLLPFLGDVLVEADVEPQRPELLDRHLAEVLALDLARHRAQCCVSGCRRHFLGCRARAPTRRWEFLLKVGLTRTRVIVQ